MRQHRSFFFALTATLMLAIFSTPTLADNGDFYVGGGLGYSFLDPQTPPGTSVEDDSDIGGKIFAGYDFPWNISLEGFYAMPGAATLSPSGEVDYKNLIGINGVYSWPTTGNGFSGFGKAGIVRADTDSTIASSNNDVNAFAGVGGRWGFGRGWALRLEYDYFFKDVQMLTFGVSKRFGLFGRKAGRAAAPAQPAQPQAQPGDADGDGVADAADTCPGTPRGVRVDTRGCQATAGQATSGSVSLDAKGLFAVGSAAVTPQGVAGIQNFAARLRQQFRQVTAIIVEGHTDSSGGASYNLRLSQQRAEAIKTQLVRAGINQAIITTRGFGESKPIAPNNTAQGRAKNRRVEIKVNAIR